MQNIETTLTNRSVVCEISPTELCCIFVRLRTHYRKKMHTNVHKGTRNNRAPAARVMPKSHHFLPRQRRWRAPPARVVVEAIFPGDINGFSSCLPRRFASPWSAIPTPHTSAPPRRLYACLCLSVSFYFSVQLTLLSRTRAKAHKYVLARPILHYIFSRSYRATHVRTIQYYRKTIPTY